MLVNSKYIQKFTVTNRKSIENSFAWETLKIVNSLKI